MKIIKKIRDLHDDCFSRYKRLSDEVEAHLKGEAEKNSWFFISRLKNVDSFALKIETGRVEDPAAMEDFFACTIIVPTIASIEAAENLVAGHYDVLERRPENDAQTFKQSSNFQFDDLRLYVAKRASHTGKNADLVGIKFEIQIKTVLQHAWSLATHDLIYKSDTVSWPKERIAFQVKAMLEHAEIAIAEASKLADAPAVAKRDERTIEILKIIEQLTKIWTSDRLPKDVKRLAETVHKMFKTLRLDPSDLTDIVEAERKRFGLLPNNLSPYAFIVQALANNCTDLQKKLSSARKFKLVIHEDMELPDWMKQSNPNILSL